MTYNVFGGTLSLTQSINLLLWTQRIEISLLFSTAASFSGRIGFRFLSSCLRSAIGWKTCVAKDLSTWWFIVYKGPLRTSLPVTQLTYELVWLSHGLMWCHCRVHGQFSPPWESPDILSQLTLIVQPLWVSWCPDTLKNSSSVCLVTCNWSSSSVNLLSTAATTHFILKIK